LLFLLLCSPAIFLIGGLCAFFAGRGKAACLIGAISATSASLLGLIPTISFLLSIARSETVSYSINLGFLPLGQILLQLDALSAFFLVPTLLLAGLCAIYGYSYFTRMLRLASIQHPVNHLGVQWLFFNLLVSGMVLMLLAADAFMFLLAWECMSLAPFFLVSLHDEEANVRAASWIYLVAAHLGALCLLALFALLSVQTGGELSFSSFIQNGTQTAGSMGLIFFLALLGFGTKAGLIPLHVWLPEAHPVAPSHVSAFMSGAMIKAGAYGLLRILTFLGPPEEWWAYLLIAAGAISAFVGILMALAQHNIKKSLAYSSVENMGIIHMAVGFGLFATATGNPTLGVLCFTAALLHLFNHALCKSLLFLSAGSVLSGTGTISLNDLGGLQKRMPFVGCCFVFGAAAISALPPFNGFAGEFFLYISLALGGAAGNFAGIIYWTGLVALAATGGFTLLCFARLYGLAFLGEARTAAAKTVEKAPLLERIPLFVLSLLCLCSAAVAPVLANFIALRVVPSIMPLSVTGPSDFINPDSMLDLLGSVNHVFLLLLLVLGSLLLLRRALLRGRKVESSPTWDCGYAAPNQRIQYSGNSFSQPAIFFMNSLLRAKIRIPKISQYFPAGAQAQLTCNDRIKEDFFRNLFLFCLGVANWSKRLQHGRVNGYILYILLTLVALLAWKVGGV
jgi:hydrogenase-4 component B